MTILPTPAPAESPESTGGPGERRDRDLGWLLDNFLVEAHGADAAVLTSRDGLPIACTGRLAVEKAEQIAAVAATLYSSGRAAGNITDPPGGEVQLLQLYLEHKALLMVSTHHQRQPTRPLVPRPAPGATVSRQSFTETLLMVLLGPDADTRTVGKQMTALIEGVAEHLRTTARVTTSGAAGSGVDGSGDER
ncbi:hypothetical protein GCM10022254_74960 [Actinomadura meridiana]|uniref:Roadblock/LAMTOR2 domain-containing protein n=1 Tax=Actinomadura meridiana TaxID=559626 RepID=A0ABP8CR40_9ACTN